MRHPDPPKRSLLDAAEFIEDLEQKGRLLNFGFFGAPVWPSLRNHLCVVISTEIDAYRGTALRPSEKTAVKGRFFDLVAHNPFFSRGARRFVVIGHTPRLIEDGRYNDLYATRLLSQLPADQTELVRLNPLIRRGEEGAEPIVYDVLGIHLLYRVLRRGWSFRLNRKTWTETVEVCERMEGEIARNFGCRAHVEKSARVAAVHYLAQRDAWKRYFRLRRCKYVILGTESYGNEGLIRAAHEWGASVIELQHGMISRIHLGYHFAGSPIVEDRPDLMLLFGSAWANSAEFPSNTRLVSYGFQPLQEFRRRIADGGVGKEEQVAILSSDPFCDEILVQTVRAIAAHHPDMRIVVRPHPRDFHDYREQLLDLEVSYSMARESVHEVLARSKYVVTGPSTSVFEASALSCNVLCWAAQFEESMEPLVDGKTIRLVTSPEDVVREIADGWRAGSGEYFDERDVNVLDVIQ